MLRLLSLYIVAARADTSNKSARALAIRNTRRNNYSVFHLLLLNMFGQIKTKYDRMKKATKRGDGVDENNRNFSNVLGHMGYPLSGQDQKRKYNSINNKNKNKTFAATEITVAILYTLSNTPPLSKTIGYRSDHITQYVPHAALTLYVYCTQMCVQRCDADTRNSKQIKNNIFMCHWSCATVWQLEFVKLIGRKRRGQKKNTKISKWTRQHWPCSISRFAEWI